LPSDRPCRYGRGAVDIETIKSALHDHIVAEILLRDEPLAPDEDLFEAGFDSMSLARVLVFVEERFGVAIPDEEVVLDEIATLDTMAAFVAGYLERAG
jgi:D-alanine--poly(phosphoribitol) ligase subunit 2